MGLTDLFKKKEGEEKKEEKEEPQGKYSQACALCGAEGTDKKWAGQYWHKRCQRKARKSAKSMF
ncbi:hypothetical protein KKG83_04785 [Candidatus Micrarchaeota archaeon]|nr:hypothetical protein [Candidatus Micrarchaeota archaeon]MBU2476761.1 hypothetical protein [Candidatus Micrarchaeota archaeon]